LVIAGAIEVFSMAVAPLLLSGVPAVAFIRLLFASLLFLMFLLLLMLTENVKRWGGKYEKKISLLIHFEFYVASLASFDDICSRSVHFKKVILPRT
jgi:hypothetical protein